MRRERLLIVDDHPILVHGLRVLLEEEPWVESLGCAGSVAEAVREAVTMRPTLVVMDVRLPDGDGIEATRRILRSTPEATVLIYTMEVDRALVSRALDAGAQGFLLKDLDLDDFVCSLRAVAGGNLVVGPRAGELLRAAPSAVETLPPPLDRLSERELRILRMMVDSTPLSGLARELGVSEKTVRNQASAIYTKLGVRDRTQAALLAARLGLDDRGAAGRAGAPPQG